MPKEPEGKTHGATTQSLPLRLLEDEQVKYWCLIGVLAIGLVAIYLNSLARVSSDWSNPQYSHGYLVPIFAIVLLWIRREAFEQFPAWHRWVGVGLITVGILLRVVGTRYVIFAIDNLSFIPCMMGIFALAGGLRCLRWAGLPIVFLVFMYPLPGFLVDAVLRPLQTLATKASTFLLQTLGVEAFRDGNRIILDNMEMGVVDQCSGLRMLTIFIALSSAIAMILTQRPIWERFILVVSAVPIAILVNVFRITITGVLYSFNVDSELVNHIFHDWAGYLMMPMALGLLFLEMQILQRIVIESDAVPSQFKTSRQPQMGYSRRS